MADLAITERSGLGLATIMARKGVAASAIGAALGLSLDDGPRRSARDGLALIGTGPGQWLAIGPDATHLAETLAGKASVSDQSGAYSVFRIAGADARALLQRSIAIDLDPSVFPPDAVATTLIAHMGAILWQTDGGFELAFFRSYRATVEAWLDWARTGLDAR